MEGNKSELKKIELFLSVSRSGCVQFRRSKDCHEGVWGWKTETKIGVWNATGWRNSGMSIETMQYRSCETSIVRFMQHTRYVYSGSKRVQKKKACIRWWKIALPVTCLVNHTRFSLISITQTMILLYEVSCELCNWPETFLIKSCSRVSL